MALGRPDDQDSADEDIVASRPGPADRAADADEVLVEVLDEFQCRLAAENSTLLADPAAVDDLRRQVRDVLDDVLSDAGPVLPQPPLSGPAGVFSAELGARRAQRGVHPVESLRAARELFAAALPIIAARRCDGDPDQVLVASLALHEAIMNRISLAALSYVDLLLVKLRASRQEERRRIARELHDRVGHGMALALQHLDLHNYFADQNPGRARDEIRVAMSSLTDALHTVQLLAAELRRSVGNDGIEGPLRAYLNANVPPSIRTDLRVIGDAKALPPNVSEELYLIMREAVRNAVRHGAPNELRLLVDVSDEMVTASVVDNGTGFNLRGTAASSGGGLSSMMERAELLGGALDLSSEAGLGTRVAVRVPLGRGGI
jgi:signal transduction histidine kinase